MSPFATAFSSPLLPSNIIRAASPAYCPMRGEKIGAKNSLAEFAGTRNPMSLRTLDSDRARPQFSQPHQCTPIHGVWQKNRPGYPGRLERVPVRSNHLSTITSVLGFDPGMPQASKVLLANRSANKARMIGTSLEAQLGTATSFAPPLVPNGALSKKAAEE